MQKKLMKRTVALIMVAMMVMISMPVSYASIVEAFSSSVAVNAISSFGQVVMAEQEQPLIPSANLNSINVFTHGAEVSIWINDVLYLNGTGNQYVIKQQDANQSDTIRVKFVVPGTNIPWPGGIDATIKQSHGDVNVALSNEIVFGYNDIGIYGGVEGEIKQIEAGVANPILTFSDLDADPNPVTDGETTDVTVWLDDQFSNGLTGQTVEIYIDGVWAGTAIEGASGVYILNGVLPIYGEVNKVTAVVGVVEIPQFENVIVNKAEGYLDDSDLDADPNTVVDGNTIDVTVWLYDQYDEPFIGETVDIYDDGVLVGTSSEISDGVYVLTNVLPAYGQTNTMSAKIGSSPLPDTEDVLVTKADGYLEDGTLNANPDSVVDGNTSIVTVELFDQYDDPFIGAIVDIYDDGVLVGIANETTPGVYTLEVLPEYGEDNIMSAMVGIYTVPDTDDVIVTKAPSVLETSDLDADPNSVVDGNTTLVTVWLYDQYGSPLTGQIVSIFDDGLSAGVAVERLLEEGVYDLVVLPMYGEINNMTAKVDSILLPHSEDVEVTKAESYLADSDLDADPNPVIEGETTNVTVWLFDQYDAPFTGQTVTIYDDGFLVGTATETSDGVYILVNVLPAYGEVNTMSAQVGEGSIPQTENVVVTKADAYLDDSTLDASPDYVTEGETTIVTVELFDQYSDPFSGQNVTIYDDGVLAGTAIETSPGVYQLEVLPELGEDNVMSAVVDTYPLPDTDDVEVEAAPAVVIVIPPEAQVEANDLILRIGYGRSVSDGEEVLSYYLVPEELQPNNVVWEIVDDSTIISLSMNDGVPTVHGELSGVAYLKVTLTFGDSEMELTDTLKVTVINYTAPRTTSNIGVTLDTDAVTLDYGESADPEFLFYDFLETVTGTTDKRVRWSLDDDTYATVDENGFVTARDDIEPGTGDIVVTVTVTTVDGGATDTAEILFLEQNPLGAIEFYDPYVFGYPGELFGPELPVTRAEVATMFAKILKMNLDFPGIQKFDDVGSDIWYFPYVQAIYRTGIFVGDGNGRFRPNDPISRAEVATVFSKLWQYIDIRVDDSPVTISDVNSQHWASQYIYQMYNAQMVVGFEDGTFRPSETTQRDQFVVMVNKLIGRPQYEAPFTKYKDINQSYWAFGDIEAATQPFVKENQLFEE